MIHHLDVKLLQSGFAGNTESSPMITFTQANVHDVSTIARIHSEELPSNLSALGAKVVKRFYNNLIRRDAGTLLTIEEDGCIAGFALFSTSSRKLFKISLMNSLSDVLYLFLNSPGKELLKHAIISKSSKDEPPVECCELVYIVISARYRNRGFGRMLLGKTEELASSRGCGSLELEVAHGNIDALTFYRSNDYMIKNELTRGRERKYRMVKALGGNLI